MNEAQPSIGEVVIRALVNFPKYIGTWTLGLIVAIISDFHITTLALTGVAVGFATSSLLIGIAAFAVIYSLSRVVANVGEAIVYAARLLGESTERAGGTISGGLVQHAMVTGPSVIKEES